MKVKANGVSFLKVLKTILDSKTETGVILLTQEQDGVPGCNKSGRLAFFYALTTVIRDPLTK